jgi:hypothetical protein
MQYAVGGLAAQQPLGAVGDPSAGFATAAPPAAVAPVRTLPEKREVSSSVGVFCAEEFVNSTFYLLFDAKRDDLDFLYRWLFSAPPFLPPLRFCFCRTTVFSLLYRTPLLHIIYLPPLADLNRR